MGLADPIATAIGVYVDDGQLDGASMAVWREGQPARKACVGWRDREAGLPVESDSIFRIASLTKPVTSMAALLLMEEGRFELNDPVSGSLLSFQRCEYCAPPMVR